jgi:hypothetical protein
VHGEEKHPYRKRLTPAHFLIDVANKGLIGYGTWKNIRKIGDALFSRYPLPPLHGKECAND